MREFIHLRLTFVFFVVAFELSTSGLNRRSKQTLFEASSVRKTYLNGFDGKKFESTIFKSADNFTNKTSLNTIVFNEDKTSFASVRHGYFSVETKLRDLNVQPISNQ